MDVGIIAAQGMVVYSILRFITAVVGVWIIVFSVQTQRGSRIVNADNITELRSVAHVDFDSFAGDTGRMDLGWFVLSETGDRLAVRDRNNELIVLDIHGRILDRFAVRSVDGLPATVVDASFNSSGDMLASVYLDGESYRVAYRQIETGTMQHFRLKTGDYPLRIWIDELNQVWLEVSPADSSAQRTVIQLPSDVGERFQSGDTLPEDALVVFPSGPENDPEAFLRIGRIQPPLAVTTTQEGLLKRWNLETGGVTAAAQLGELPGLGQLNATARYFTWRDAESTALYLLDFESGENRLVASLNGEHVPLLLLTRNADIIIGIQIAGTPLVVAWYSATGERLELGEYRSCNRQPDMVRLSRDGTTLVIGCDTGLDIWRIGSSAA